MSLSWAEIENLLTPDERAAARAALERRQRKKTRDAERDAERLKQDLALQRRRHGELLRARQNGGLSRWLSLKGETQTVLAERYEKQLSTEEWDAFRAYQRRLREVGLTRSTVRDALGCTEAELSRWIEDGRLAPDGLRFTNVRRAMWIQVWLPERIAPVCEHLTEWRERDAARRDARRREAAASHRIHGRVTALLNRIEKLPGDKILTVVVGADAQAFDVSAGGQIGHAPEHQTQLRRRLAHGMAAGGYAIVRQFLPVRATMETARGTMLLPVKQIYGVLLEAGTWIGLTARQTRTVHPSGEQNLVFADFPA